MRLCQAKRPQRKPANTSALSYRLKGLVFVSDSGNILVQAKCGFEGEIDATERGQLASFLAFKVSEKDSGGEKAKELREAPIKVGVKRHNGRLSEERFYFFFP